MYIFKFIILFIHLFILFYFLKYVGTIYQLYIASHVQGVNANKGYEQFKIKHFLEIWGPL